jgi:hypothetical protein
MQSLLTQSVVTFKNRHFGRTIPFFRLLQPAFHFRVEVQALACLLSLKAESQPEYSALTRRQPPQSVQQIANEITHV